MKAVLAAVLLLAPAPSGTVLFHLHDARLAEVSGIAAGIASPNVLYVHNDSGDSARFFALDKRSGDVLAEYHVPGAHNVDWEDIAVGPCSAGSCLYIADTGDNDEKRKDTALYRAPEPRQGATSVKAERFPVRYPHGARDAEALFEDSDLVARVVPDLVLRGILVAVRTAGTPE